jgi:hypothetical protein
MNTETGKIIDEKELETLNYEEVKRHVKLSEEEYNFLAPMTPEERVIWYQKIQGKKQFESDKEKNKAKAKAKRRAKNKLKNKNRKK